MPLPCGSARTSDFEDGGVAASEGLSRASTSSPLSLDQRARSKDSLEASPKELRGRSYFAAVTSIWKRMYACPKYLPDSYPTGSSPVAPFVPTG